MEALTITVWLLSIIFFTKVLLDVSKSDNLAGFYGLEFELTPLTVGLAFVFYTSMIYLNPWGLAL